MYKALVIDVQGNIASVMLDDQEVFDIEISQPVNIGEDVLFSADQIVNGQRSYFDNPEDEEYKPSFEW